MKPLMKVLMKLLRTRADKRTGWLKDRPGNQARSMLGSRFALRLQGKGGRRGSYCV
jgi:hypothetical protein